VRPIAPEEGLFVVPEGSIHLLNLSALPSETPGRFLVEELPPLAVLTAERDLARRSAPAQAARLLAVGGPDFDYRPRQVARASTAADEVPDWVARWKGLAESARQVAERFLRNPCRSDQTLYFTPLKAARTEAEWVSSWMKEHQPSLGTETALGAQATEAWFKRESVGATSLHIASHGFFDLSCTADAGLSELTELPRSGIALVGANWSSEALPGAEDGLLMANEIAGLDLSSVQEVVVSACESAVGSASEGEGVFGMTRAFRLAGVRNQVVSLWPVDDSATLAWMQRFYRARSAGASTVEAVKLASVETLRSGGEEASSPAVWAGFVPVIRGLDR
jgi:CHAT domain-containing protein